MDGLYGSVTVTRVQPYQATRTYLCPGCQQEIAVGLGHLVVVPDDMPDDRRHWHRACWTMRHRRPPGRGR
ncbi:MAG TPA: hypothetical protein VHI95_01455 [Acidimicrobiales bacterium]|jgi:hypothetical protein|nr:hypothetical protein [Acidimicrobiales bacterium]